MTGMEPTMSDSKPRGSAPHRGPDLLTLVTGLGALGIATVTLLGGIAYIVAIEGFIANADFVGRTLTVVYYVRALVLRWLDLPPELVGKALGGRYRGQRQRWFALRFEGSDADIRLDLDPHPEFDAWRWVELAELPGLAVGFKRAIYDVLAVSFARFAASPPR